MKKYWVLSVLFGVSVALAGEGGAGADGGRGTLGRDLLDYKEITSPRLVKLNNEVVKRVKALNLDGLPELKTLRRELGSPIFEMTEDAYKDPNQYPGDWKYGGLLYGYTDLRPGAPTFIYPVAFGADKSKSLSNVQLKQLLLHEALHRALPAPLNRREEAVVAITRTILLYADEEAVPTVQDYIAENRNRKETVYVKFTRDARLPSVDQFQQKDVQGEGFPPCSFEDVRRMGGGWLCFQESERQMWGAGMHGIYLSQGEAGFDFSQIYNQLEGLETAINEWTVLKFSETPPESSSYFEVSELDLRELQPRRWKFDVTPNLKVYEDTHEGKSYCKLRTGAGQAYMIDFSNSIYYRLTDVRAKSSLRNELGLRALNNPLQTASATIETTDLFKCKDGYEMNGSVPSSKRKASFDKASHVSRRNEAVIPGGLASVKQKMKVQARVIAEAIAAQVAEKSNLSFERPQP